MAHHESLTRGRLSNAFVPCWWTSWIWLPFVRSPCIVHFQTKYFSMLRMATLSCRLHWRSEMPTSKFGVGDYFFAVWHTEPAEKKKRRGYIVLYSTSSSQSFNHILRLRSRLMVEQLAGSWRIAKIPTVHEPVVLVAVTSADVEREFQLGPGAGVRWGACLLRLRQRINSPPTQTLPHYRNA